MCWDLERVDWRTFRLHRMSRPLRTGVRSAPRPLPVDDLTAMVTATDTDGEAPSVAAVAHLDISLDEARRVFGVWATGATANPDGGLTGRWAATPWPTSSTGRCGSRPRSTGGSAGPPRRAPRSPSSPPGWLERWRSSGGDAVVLGRRDRVRHYGREG